MKLMQKIRDKIYRWEIKRGVKGKRFFVNYTFQYFIDNATKEIQLEMCRDDLTCDFPGWEVPTLDELLQRYNKITMEDIEKIKGVI